jgi:hypothetical protein
VLCIAIPNAREDESFAVLVIEFKLFFCLMHAS